MRTDPGQASCVHFTVHATPRTYPSDRTTSWWLITVPSKVSIGPTMKGAPLEANPVTVGPDIDPTTSSEVASMRNITTEPAGKAAPAGEGSPQPAPNEKTILVCRPGGKWSTEVIA